MIDGSTPSAVEACTRGLKCLVAERPLRLRVSGDCMAPRLRHGEEVEIRPARLYLPGDVVALRAAGVGSLRVHRVLGATLLGGRLALVTKGDAFENADPPTLTDDVVGRVSPADCPVAWTHRLRALWSFSVLAGRALRRRLG